jgi:hypothetical protein
VSVFSGLGAKITGFFKGAGSAVVSGLSELAEFLTKIQAIIDRWQEIKEEWDALFEPQEVDKRLKMFVVRVDVAQQVLEDIRLNALKDRATKIYQEILDLIQLTLHPLGGSEAGDQAILAGAAAYGGGKAPTGAFRAASLLNTALNFGDNVLKIEDKILEIIQLLDVIDDMRDQIEAGRLKQGNTQIRVDGFTRQRQGRLHGKAQ